MASVDPVLSELLAHFGLSDFEAALNADKFGVENLLQVRSEKDHEGFFEHFDVAGFLHQNRFKTLIAAIPGLKRTSRIPADTAKVQHFDLPVHRAAAAAGNYHAQAHQMVPFGGATMGANPYLSMSMMNPMMGGMGAMGGMSAMGGFPQSMMSPWGAATMPAAGAAAGAKPAKVKRTPSRAASSSSSSSSSAAALASGGSLDGDDNGEDDSMFASEEATEDVQFGISKPWIGTVAALTPDGAPKNNASLPSAQLALEWVYGVKSDDTRQHVHIDARNRIVFPAAAVLVAYDAAAHTQAHFFGANDEITCVAQDPTDANVFVCGQGAALVDKRASDPYLTIIDVGANKGAGGDAEAAVKLPKRHKRGICAVAVSVDGGMAASCGLDNEFTVIVWDLKDKLDAIGTATAANKTKILHMAWSTTAVNEFCGVGDNTVAFYSQPASGKSLKVTAANFGSASKQLFTCVAYTKKGTCIVGAKDGSVYAFGDQTCKKVFPGVHQSVITTLLPFDGGVLSAAAGQVRVNNAKLEQIRSFSTEDAFARSVALRGSTLVVATNQADILVVGNVNADSAPEIVHSGHHDGELWAVAPHPDASTGLFASVGEDNKLIVWDAQRHSAVKVAPISNEAGVARRKVVRAATTSSAATNHCARAIAYSPDAKHLAVGTNEGKCCVYDAQSLALVASVDLNAYGKANNKNPEHWIQCLSYNPAGTCLAVGTHGSVIVLLDVAKNYAFAEKLSSHNAAVTALDWSTDGRFIASVCLGYELLFHKITPALKGSARENAPAVKNAQWATTTCKFGWAVNGIFRPDQNGFSIKSVNIAGARDLLVTGEDSKCVNLWRCPANAEGNAFASYAGHASFVTAVRFTADDARVLSCGGNDKCIFQWAVRR